MSTLAVQVLGDIFSPSMQPVQTCVEALIKNGAEVRTISELSHACALSADWFPDLILVCQHWPDEFTESDVRRLLTAFPLARLVCCYGPWCESDGRTREIWPLSVRVPARSASGRIDRELEVLAGARPPLPPTASRDEIFLFDVDDSVNVRFGPV